jgi:hypothetical protein
MRRRTSLCLSSATIAAAAPDMYSRVPGDGYVDLQQHIHSSVLLAYTCVLDK